MSALSSSQVSRRRAIGDGLVVGDEHEQFDAGRLQPDAVGQRAEEMADMQRPGRPVAGQDTELAGISGDREFQVSTALLAREYRRGVGKSWHDVSLLV